MNQDQHSGHQDVVNPSTDVESAAHAEDPFRTEVPQRQAEISGPQREIERLEHLIGEIQSSFESEPLDEFELNRLKDLGVQFDERWKSNETPDIGEFVSADLSESARQIAVRMLVDADIAHRERRGLEWTPADYLKRLPDFRYSVECACWSRLHQLFRSAHKSSSQSGHASTTGSTFLPRARSASEQRFLATELHAKGGLGAVFKAHDQQLNRIVALKEIRSEWDDDPDSRTRFTFEAEITGNLEHPGIVPVYGYGTYESGRPYYAMRFITGVSFRTAIHAFHDKHPKLTADVFLSQEFRSLIRRFIDACNAIHFAHDKGVLHRDIKPDNVMLGSYGETLVVDWGLAKCMDDGRVAGDDGLSNRAIQLHSARQSGNSVVGTILFMSPEQALGRNELLTQATDIYSLGAMFFNMLTNSVAVAGANPMEMLENVRQGNILDVTDFVPTVPRPLVSICRQAMALNPSDRYRTASELADDVERWLSDELVQAHANSETVSDRAGRLFRRYRSWTFAIIASLAVITLVSVVSAALISRAKRRESEAKSQAIVAKDQALRFYTIAGTSIDDWLVKSSDSLKYVDGAETIRKRLLTMAAEDYRKLASLKSRDPQTELARGRVFLRLGDIARREFDTRAAREEYHQASLILSAIDSTDAVAELANTQIRIGQCAVLDNDLDKAIDHYGDAHELLKQAATSGDNEFIARSTSAAHINHGEVLFAKGKFDEAEERLKNGLSALTNLKSASAELTQKDLSDIAIARVYLARIHLQRSSYPDAEQQFVLAKDDLNQLTEGMPDYPPYLERRADVEASLAELFAETGDLDRELAASRSAKQDYESLVNAVPGDWEYQQKLAYSITNIANALHRQDNSREAIDLIAEAEQAFIRLAPLTGVTIDLLTCLDVKGQIETDLGRTEDANTHLASVIDRYQQAVNEQAEIDPTYPDLRERLAVALSHYALALHLDGQFDLADEASSNAIVMLGKLADEFADLPRYRGLLAIALERQGVLRNRQPRADATRSLELAIAAWESVPVDKLSPRQAHDFAWLLATLPDPSVRGRYASQALQLAKRAVANVKSERFLATLALAQIASDPAQAAETVETLMKAPNHFVARTHFIRALAKSALNDFENARQDFIAGEEWRQEQMPGSYQLLVLRDLVVRALPEDND